MSKNHRRNKPPHATLRLLAVLSLFILPGRAVADAFTVDDWFLGIGVDNFFSGERETDGFLIVQNPFQDSHIVAVGASTAESSYDFIWSGAVGSGTFLVDAAHQAQDVGGPGLVSSSSGFVWLSTNNDVTLDVLGLYNYNTPATYFDTEIRISVARADPFEVLLDVAQHGGPFGGNPSSGTLNIGGNVVLPAGDTYIIRYLLEVNSFGGGTNILGTGSGNMSFNITPEPSTLSLLAVAALACLKRRRPPPPNIRRLTTPHLAHGSTRAQGRRTVSRPKPGCDVCRTVRRGENAWRGRVDR